MDETLSFENLVENVGNVHNNTSGAAKGAVNQLLTIRNWAIGCYIVEFEQNGADRAEYGSRLLDNLAKELSIDGLGRLQLNLCRIFYQKYPQICSTVSNRLKSLGGIKELPIALPTIDSMGPESGREICSTSSNKFETDPAVLISRLSFFSYS